MPVLKYPVKDNPSLPPPPSFRIASTFVLFRIKVYFIILKYIIFKEKQEKTLIICESSSQKN